MSERALNRALLARQGLLDRLRGPVGSVVASVGALQMQYWPALRPALWSRMADCPPEGAFQAHDAGELLTGTLLRGTIHTVAAGEYAAYATVAAASKVTRWRAGQDPDPDPGMAELTAALRRHGTTARPVSELVEFVESWVAANPDAVSAAELQLQREFKWTGLIMQARFLRAPADGIWGTRTPALFVAAPLPGAAGKLAEPGRLGEARRADSAGSAQGADPGSQAREVAEPADVQAALEQVIGCHLRAFGPAAAEDVASWIAWNLTPVRAALERMPGLVRFTDESGRILYDLPGSPRPDPATPAPVRLLPWFDSTLLAYAPKRRTRILPEPYRNVVYVKANAQLKPTFLVDGMVAGMWSVKVARGAATLSLMPFQPLSASVRKELLAEAEGLLTFSRPDARSHHVELA
ncbi:hypothetical protein Aph01nite_25080 [Acrocarpospora phusangensis]|uniref:Winged helix DNA-binding domain-containing protein n=1 Tax=Acrocarpospora phusangensis TaxID=1070424 RepID=A0A919UNC7_9ACTN|nr:winged helix DNA-binding domain-containing protein [Acrocarpospora phusangensis]GIH24198.1 hypothetical protein Aph01nite_25080 [Acrocarpospora phusangensis]